MASDPLAGIVTSTEGMQRELAAATKVAVRKGAEAVRTELLDAARARGRARFRGSKLGVAITTMGSVSPVAIGRAGRSAGAWAIAEDGAKPHDIKPRKAGGLKLPARTPSGRRKTDPGVRGKAVRHPGMAGTGAWTAGHVAAEPDVDRIVDEAMVAALDRRF